MIRDILITNSDSSLSTTFAKKLAEDEIPVHTIRDNKVVGFVFSSEGERLKYISIRLFKGEEFIEGKHTDATGKFAFENLRNGEYKLATEDNKTIQLRIKT